MIYAATYTDNLTAFRQWLFNNKDNYKEIISSDGVWLNVPMIPTRTNGDRSISFVCVDNMDFIDASPLEVLAWGDNQDDVWQEVLDTPSKKQKLDLAYPRPVIDYTDEDGNQQQYQEPPIPGVIYV